jgi:hypothetical protein
VRAAEFLGLFGGADPQDTLLEALRSAQSGVEANLILNTVVLLRDRIPSHRFAIPRELFKFPQQEMELINRRLEYLHGSD